MNPFPARGTGDSNRYGHGNDFGSHNNFGQGDQDNSNSGTQIFGDGSSVVSGNGAARPVADGSRDQNIGDKSRNVFVVHGRDEQVRREMFELLRRLDLRPLEWEDLVKATDQTVPFLGDVVAQAPAQAQAALVLLTPDDVVKLHPQLLGEKEPPYETQLTGQPRPNVLIELGMVLMAYPKRTLIIEVGELRQIADLSGRNVIRFDGSQNALGKIVARLKQAGCKVNDTGSDWNQTWPFRNLAAYHRKP